MFLISVAILVAQPLLYFMSVWVNVKTNRPNPLQHRHGRIGFLLTYCVSY